MQMEGTDAILYESNQFDMASRICILISAVLFFAATILADATFDLSGPPIQIKVDRNKMTLPIAEVPNLLEGDRLYIHPNLPEDQAAHYLLIVTFLRGSTNPPPENWFIKAELWNKKFREEGIFVTVPQGAQQAVIFLAPATSGDFSTLRSAVRGRPGSFVRAVQDLDRASLDRSRLDLYLDTVHKVAEDDPAKVHDATVLLARSLNIQLQDDCFKKPLEEQASCLVQKGGELILTDGHSQSMVGTLTNGPSSDLIGQLSYTPQAGSGYFSPYIGAIVDMGRILDSLHTAQYQYIPALSLPKKDMLDLKLNNPPSFHNPKSVIVVALPAVASEQAPPLKPVAPDLGACVQKNPLVLQATGAPLAFSTQLLHDMTLHVETKSGKEDLPVTANPALGGFVVNSDALAKAKLDTDAGHSIKGTLRGSWGFNPFNGPTFTLVVAKKTKWEIPPADSASLMTGEAHALHLNSDEAVCVDHVTLDDANKKELKTSWKVAKADEVDVAIPAESTDKSGPVTLNIKQWGIPQDDSIPLRIFGQPGELKGFEIIAGDVQGVLHGNDLQNVATVDLKGAQFKPDSAGQKDNSAPVGELRFVTTDSSVTSSLQPNQNLSAHVKLNDGRTLDVPVTVQPPRPRVHLLSKQVVLGAASQSSEIHLADQSELPLDGQLSFAIKTDQPAAFPRNEKVEIATADDAFKVFLSTQDGSLTLQDPQTVVGQFNPAKSFGPSAFGPLKFRAVEENGTSGDWQPLAKLVRVPVLTELDCTADATQLCTLKGTNLFLLDSVAADAQFSHPASVPEGFLNSTLAVPHPADGALYIKLRDDPVDVNVANVPSGQPPVPPPTQPAAAPALPHL
jgi:hypothetical protein